jgi:DNA-binding CsgD family transcriptional regulator
MKMRLTKQQRAVLKGLAEGKTPKEIALEIKRVEKTVHYHWQRIRERLGIQPFALLVQYALKHRVARYLVLLPALLLLAFTGIPLRNSVTFLWNYPASELSTNLTFRIYASSDVIVPSTNWTVLTNVVGTNLQVTVPMQPTNLFFFITASNLWGEGPPSAVVATPPPPRNGSLTIQ